MISRTITSINFVFHHVNQKTELVFWLLVRFFSAALPLVTIYQFSQLVDLIEKRSSFAVLLQAIFSILLVRLLDNFLRLRSTTKLDYLISNISFDIHNFFLIDFKPQNKDDRNLSIQSIRNFADATVATLTMFKQPGIDSLVSVIFIPIALYFVDFQSAVLIISYILIYSLVNFYSNQRYKELRDLQNTKTEAYYAKLQDSNDVDLEQSAFTRHFHRLTNWNFIEWVSLQNVAVIFYFIFLLHQIYLVTQNTGSLSHLILVMGYVSQTQSFLNSFTDVWYGLGDMSVALKHLAKNHSISVIDLDDLT